MAQARPKLTGESRSKTGTKYASRLRRTGKLPAVIYGHGIDPAHVAIEAEQVVHALHSGAHLLDVDLQGKTQTVLVKDVQYDYLGDNVIHVDLARVDLSEEVTVWVHLNFLHEDQCTALQSAGAFLEHPNTDVEIRCRADSIPEHIDVDLTNLTAEEPITVADLALPPGVKAESDPETVVAAISTISEEEIEQLAEAGAEAATAAEPELIGREPKEEGEAEAAEAPEKPEKAEKPEKPEKKEPKKE